MDTLSRPIEYLLSGISSTSAIITRFIRSVRVAHADLAAVTRDLSDLRLLLELMREEPQCSDTGKWINTGRAEMASCRDSLATFREALGLALEVATLPSLRGNPADVTAAEDNITNEVQRLQTSLGDDSSGRRSVESRDMDLPPGDLRRQGPNIRVGPPRVDLTHILQLADKDKKSKGPEILHIDTSPALGYIATKHANKTIKVWSIARKSLHSTIKTKLYVQPKVRSREYFIRSHAILSENANLIGVTTHFGLTLEIYDFQKGGNGAKKVQAIEEAHRWAVSPRDAYHSDYAPLAVYRPKGDRIDLFFLARDANAKCPFIEGPSHSIELLKADLPFVPKFPELAYSSENHYLIAAAGPRPGDPSRARAVILIAWFMKPVSESKSNLRNPGYSSTSLPDDSRHIPYRVCVPEYPVLQTALPTCLVSHGNTAVSIWIPAPTPTTTQPEGPTDPKRSFTFPRSPANSSPQTVTNVSASTATSERYVLSWHLPTNTTRIFSIPNVQSCVSPDCRLLAYCDPGPGTSATASTGGPKSSNPSTTDKSPESTASNSAGQFVIVDIPTAREMYRSPRTAVPSWSATPPAP
ncbi:hypothetical protein VTK26DRAFT_695 [Humicola hyalothermophila]